MKEKKAADAPEQQRHPYLVVIVGAIIIAMAAVAEAYVWHRQQAEAPAPTATPTASPAASSSASPSPTASPSPVASPTPAPSASASPTASAATLPASATQVVADFYADYKAKDRAKLATLMTPDTTDELRSLHSRLFTGLDTNGDPGGPTLFSTNSAIQSVASYSVSKAEASGKDWLVTVNEQRLNGSGQAAGSVTTVLALVPSGSSWLVDAYAYSGGTAGKYNGFLIPS